MGQEVALVAVTLIFGVPIAAFYTYYRVRKLRTEEKLAAIARAVPVPMEPELSEAARSRRSGILLTAGALGFMTTFALLGRTDPDAWNVVSFGAIPLALGMGFFVDSTLVRRELRS